MAEVRSSFFIPLQILITKEEPLKRLTHPTRREKWRSIDSQDAEDNGPLLSISHPHFLELEVSHLSPEDATGTMTNHIKNFKEN